VKKESKLKNLTTKMLSAKFSTNPESFKAFGRGHRIDLAISYGYTHISILLQSIGLIVLSMIEESSKFFFIRKTLNNTLLNYHLWLE
jgi:hypothetical protein